MSTMISPALPSIAPDAYWVLPGQFLAGEYPAHKFSDDLTRQRLSTLLTLGMDTFIDLTQAGELAPYQATLAELAGWEGLAVTYQRMPMKDIYIPSVAEMTTILDTIDTVLSAGRKVYLHCWGGVGRTGTVVGCYLVRHGLSGTQALQRIPILRQSTKKAYRASPETDEQSAMVRNWQNSENFKV